MASNINDAGSERDVFEKIKSDFSSNGDLISIGELLKFAYEKKHADTAALISQDRSVTYRELYFYSVELSKKLQATGIKPRDKVVIYVENSIFFYVAYFAVLQIGGIVVPLNIFLHEKELSYIITESNPSLVFCSNALKSNLDKLWLNWDKNIPTIFTQDVIDWDVYVPEKIKFDVTVLDPDELCALLYTSGTTGVPKGVMLSSRNMLTNAIQSCVRFHQFGLNKHDKFFCVLPLFHVFAQCVCIWLPIIMQATVIIVSKIDRKQILDGLRHKPGVFLGFPALFGMLCLMRNAPLDSVKVFVSGADMLPDKIRAAFALIYGRKICAGYGLSEASPVVAVNYQNHASQTNNVGAVLDGIECEIRDDNEVLVENGVIGNLWIKGDNVMLGYYMAPEATAKILKNGWLNTGDLGMIAKDGTLAVCGRTKDVIIHKGFNIYPVEIENILLRHPSVVKAAVVGKLDVDTGQIAVAFVAVKSVNSAIEVDLRELCASNLAAYKVPKKIICVEDLPMNATGKVDKKQLQV